MWSTKWKDCFSLFKFHVNLIGVWPSRNSLAVAKCPSVQSPAGYVGVNKLSLLIPESPQCHTLTLLAQDRSFQVPCVNTEVLSGEQTSCHLIYQSTVDSDSSAWFRAALGGRNRIIVKRGLFITQKEGDWDAWAIKFAAGSEGQEAFQLPASRRSSCLMQVSSSVGQLRTQ